MSEFIQVEKSKVLAAFENAMHSEKATLSELFPGLFKKSPLERIFSFTDVCNELGLDPVDFELKPEMTQDEIHDLHSRKIKLVYKCFNGDWIPDFENKSQPKYYPFFEYKKGSGFVLNFVLSHYGFTFVGARLCSHSEETVEHICKHFIKEYNNYLLS